MRAAELQARQPQPLITIMMTPQGPAAAMAIPLEQAIQVTASVLESFRMMFAQSCAKGASAIEVVGAAGAPAQRS
jgi:hypothetical protein